MLRRKTPLDIIEFLFLVNVNQNVSVYGFGEAGPFHLARLENDIAVGQDDRRPPLLDVFNDIKGVRIQTVGKRIIHQEVGDGQQARLARMLASVALQRPEVIGVTEFVA